MALICPTCQTDFVKFQGYDDEGGTHMNPVIIDGVPFVCSHCGSVNMIENGSLVPLSRQHLDNL